MFKESKTREYIMTPGIQKLNIQQNRSAKQAIATNLGSKPRSTGGVSYGIFGQRSTTGLGLHLTNRGFNSQGMSDLRHSLNDNRTMLFNNIGKLHHCNHNDGNNTMNKFMAGMMAMNMMAQLGAQTVDAVNSAKASKADKSNKSDVVDVDSSKTKTKAKDLKDLNKQLTDVNKKVEDFTDDYAKTKGLSDVQTSITDVKALLNQAGISDISLSELNLSELNLMKGSLLTEIDTAINTIQNTDISAIDTFSGNLGSVISNIDTQLQQLSADKSNAATNASKINQLQSAKAKLETLRDSQLPKLKTNLTQQKTELEAIKKEKADAMDNVYNQAKADDDKIGENNTEMTKLQSEISKETDDKKKKKLIDKYNGLADANKALQSGLQMHTSPIVDSRGNSYSLQNVNSANITHYTSTGNDTSDGGKAATSQTSLGGGANSQLSGLQSAFTTPQLNMSSVKGAITIGGKVYIQIGDKYMCDGKEFTKAEVLGMMVNQPMNFSFDMKTSLS